MITETPMTNNQSVSAAHGESIYMLRDEDGRVMAGPFRGKPGLDLTDFVSEFRSERYAKAEASGEDFCFIDSGDIVSWLVALGVLAPLKTVSLQAHVDTHGENSYVPSHWPVCPSCGTGRGEESMGRVLRSFNRANWHRKCTKCGHTWGDHDEPYIFKLPMLEDDGRYVASGCVPYSISQAGGIQMDRAVEVCRSFGWNEGDGIDEVEGIAAARACGLEMVSVQPQRIAGSQTLRKVLDRLPRIGIYIVATREHWLAFANGENLDPAETHLRTEVTGCWEVRPYVSKS